MNTQDISKFGIREKLEAGNLLKAYGENGAEFLTDGVTVEFNPNSGMVFLVDEDFNVAVLDGDKLVQFFNCPQCGNEGTDEDYPFTKHEGYCSKQCQKENE